MLRGIHHLDRCGNAICLDYVNTVHPRSGSERHEYLRSYADLAAWARDGGLVSDRQSGALTDLADGYLARKHGIESVLGKLMDPLADKVLVATPLIMLIPMGRVPAWVSLLIITRELAVTGLRGLAAANGIVVSASGLGKIKSIFQYTALCVLIFPAALLPIPFLHDLGRIILYVSLLLTVWSGVDYFVKLQRLYLSPSDDL